MEVRNYNPSVSFADSSPYTGEPLPRTTSNYILHTIYLYKFSVISQMTNQQLSHKSQHCFT